VDTTISDLCSCPECDKNTKKIKEKRDPKKKEDLVVDLEERESLKLDLLATSRKVNT